MNLTDYEKGIDEGINIAIKEILLLFEKNTKEKVKNILLSCLIERNKKLKGIKK